MSEPSILPFFASGHDPGPSFVDLLHHVAPAAAAGVASDPRPESFPITHATTVVAIRSATGVVMAGDRGYSWGSPDSAEPLPPGHATLELAQRVFLAGGGQDVVGYPRRSEANSSSQGLRCSVRRSWYPTIVHGALVAAAIGYSPPFWT